MAEVKQGHQHTTSVGLSRHKHRLSDGHLKGVQVLAMACDGAVPKYVNEKGKWRAGTTQAWEGTPALCGREGGLPLSMSSGRAGARMFCDMALFLLATLKGSQGNDHWPRRRRSLKSRDARRMPANPPAAATAATTHSRACTLTGRPNEAHICI